MTLIGKEKISNFLRENLRSLVWQAGLLFLFGAGLAVFFHFQNKREKQINEMLYGYKQQLEQAGKKANGKDYNRNSAVDLFLYKEKDVIYSDEMKRIANQFEQFLKENKGREISIYFVIDLADFYFKSGQKKKAQSLLEMFSNENRFSTAYQLARLQLASYYMDEKLCEKALPVLEGAIHKKKPGLFDTEIYLKKGLCYEKTNQKEQARQSYQKVIEKEPESPSAIKAKDYLLVMRLKGALKESSDNR